MTEFCQRCLLSREHHDEGRPPHIGPHAFAPVLAATTNDESVDGVSDYADTRPPVPAAGTIPAAVKMCNAETSAGRVCRWAVHSGDYHSWHKDTPPSLPADQAECHTFHSRIYPVTCPLPDGHIGYCADPPPPSLAADLRGAVERLCEAARWAGADLERVWCGSAARFRFAPLNLEQAVAEVRRLLGDAGTPS